MRKTILLLLALSLPATLFALGQTRYVETTAGPRSFALVGPRGASPIVVDSADWPGVIRAVSDLRDDIQRVTNLQPSVVGSDSRRTETMVLIGTIGKSPLIDQLIRDKKIDVSGIQGKWESFFLQTVESPLPGIANGHSNQNRLPRPTSLSMWTSPPIFSINFLTMANPRPVPPCLRVVDPSA